MQLRPLASIAASAGVHLALISLLWPAQSPRRSPASPAPAAELAIELVSVAEPPEPAPPQAATVLTTEPTRLGERSRAARGNLRKEVRPKEAAGGVAPTLDEMPGPGLAAPRSPPTAPANLRVPESLAGSSSSTGPAWMPETPRPSGPAAGPRWRAHDDGSAMISDGLVTADIGADGQVRSIESPPPVELDMRNLGVRFDLTDMVAGAAGRDPYSSRKLALLDETRAARAAMGARERSAALARSLKNTRARLRSVWRSAGAPRERRRILFALWDECAERGPDDVVATAARVRSIIEAFVREELPEGSPMAFDDDELEALNRSRSSRQRFDPYRQPAAR